MEVMYSQTDISIVITDIIMPGKNGLETITEIRRKYPEIKILAISGDEYNLNLARNTGAHLTLLKPFNKLQLLSALSKLQLNMF